MTSVLERPAHIMVPGQSFEHGNHDEELWFDGRRATIHNVEIEDPFVNESHDRITDGVRLLTEVGGEFYAGRGELLGAARKRTSATYSPDNPASVFLVHQLGESFRIWITRYVPTAAALGPIYNPYQPCLPDGTYITDEMRAWLCNIADTIGIRSRGAQFEQIIRDERERFRPGEPFKMLSLACGAGYNVLRAVEEAKQSGADIRATLVDYDKETLHQVRQDASRLEIDDRIRTVRANVLRRKNLILPASSWGGVNFSAANILTHASGLAQEQGQDGEYDLVDAVGILEYLKKEDWVYTYNKVISTKKPMAGAVTFLKNAWQHVKPGGLLVVGNMLDTHPQLGFTMNAVQWPHVQPRPMEEVLEMMQLAGLHGELDVYCPSDGVYALYALRKPEYELAA